MNSHEILYLFIQGCWLYFLICVENCGTDGKIQQVSERNLWDPTARLSVRRLFLEVDEFKARVHFTTNLHYTKKITWNNSWVILNCYFGSFTIRVWTTVPGNLQTSCAAFTSKSSKTLWPKIVRRKLFQVWRLWPQRPSWSSCAHRWSKRTCGPRMFFTYWIKKIKVIFFQWLGWCHTLRLKFVRSLVGINDYVLF